MTSTSIRRKKKTNPRNRKPVPVGPYRSKLEARVAEVLGKGWEYEPEVIEYIQKKDYLPDFRQGNVIIEVKGFFRSGDASKYKAIARACEEYGLLFIMLFSHPYAKVRKDSKTTYAKWADTNNIKWFGTEDISDLKRFLMHGEDG